MNPARGAEMKAECDSGLRDLDGPAPVEAQRATMQQRARIDPQIKRLYVPK
jgi:hypothetical protein